ncbi:MAG: ATP-dependent RNA helicase DbpA [Chroococcopsis gigantea SAG 12.99]|nr:ATP-dependent RNA helicase DbpA [Chroococcopsis gigantea SAG 12.99]
MNQSFDPAALFRTLKQESQDVPPYLRVGKTVHSPQYGTGEVAGSLKNCLIVKFPGYSIPVSFPDWQQAIKSGELIPSEAEKPQKDEAATKSPQLDNQEQEPAWVSPFSDRIQQIEKPEFRSLAGELAEQIQYINTIRAVKGEKYQLPEDLPAPLRKALNDVGIKYLYEHQLTALQELRRGKDLTIATPTASGKTLCYNIAILESCLRSPLPTALYIFPLKALGFDQMRKLENLIQALPEGARLKPGQMTGDTTNRERKELFYPAPPRILAVSPDLLHYQLDKARQTSHWQGWREFLRRLRWVVIDEAHTYIGAFGAHFANLMRRLRRTLDSLGGDSERLQFICTSATLGNPGELSSCFSGRSGQVERLHQIDKSTGKSACKTVLSLAPSNSPNSDATKIVLSLLEQGLSGIVFCNSRGGIKNLLKLIHKEAASSGMEGYASQVAPFYGSLQAQQRRELIQRVERGTVRVILSTSALEAGIDLPELDCCLIRGYPGSLMSFRQRIGRVGRQNPGLVIFLPMGQEPLDHYYATYPDRLLNDEVESVVFNPDYPTILAKHILCCCAESGLPLAEVSARFGKTGGGIAGGLLEQGKIFLCRDNCLRSSGNYHPNVSLRGSVQQEVKLIDISTGETIEKMNLELAHREVFPGAIYSAADSNGKLVVYECLELNLDNLTASLKLLPPDSEQFTGAETLLSLSARDAELLEEPKIISTPISDGRLRTRLHWGEITSLVNSYKLFSRRYVWTCRNSRCPSYHFPAQGKRCPGCNKSLGYAEVKEVIKEVKFEEPYRTQYQAPVLKIESNPSMNAAIEQEVKRLRTDTLKRYGGEIPEVLKSLWQSAPEYLALHSMGHQLLFALPLLVLSSFSDVNYVVVSEGKTVASEDKATGKRENRIVGYFFDTCDGGNGGTEAIFHNLPLLATKALSLVGACDCRDGCPKCLTQHACPQQNESLNKALGIFMLKAIAGREQL